MSDVNITIADSQPIDVTLADSQPIAVTIGEGIPGAPGIGVPTGGTAGQVLTKDTATDFDTSWQDATVSGAVDSVNGETGSVILDANDIGADPAGSAVTAESNAKAYTDTQISSINVPSDVSDLTDDTGIIPTTTSDLTNNSNFATTSQLFSGNYTDLTNKPTIPTNNNQLTNGNGYISSETDPVFTASQASNITAGDIAKLSNLSGVNTGDQDLSSYALKSELSDNNYTDAEKSKLSGIQAGAEVNVKPDWNASSGDAQILNKPTLFSGSYNDLTNKPVIPAQFNPIAGANVSLSGTYPNITFNASGGGGGQVNTVVAGSNIDVDSTDPTSPVISVEALTASDITDFNSSVASTPDVANNTSARHTHANKTVLDATTASFTTADKTKLSGVQAGAEVNAVDSVNGKTGVVVLDHTDVGADAGGASATAEANAKNYTDTQINALVIPDDISDLTDTTGAIPTATSDLTNDSGFITTETDPTVPTWAKAPSKPNYTKAEVGLGNVDNTSDLNKPISTATQTVLDTKVDEVAGKGLSTEDYTTAEKDKLAGIATGAEVNTVDSVAGKTGAVTIGASDLTATGISTSKYLRGDNTWQTPPNTTYAEISSAEITSGTASTARAISGRRSQEIVNKARTGVVLDTRTVNGHALSSDVTVTKGDVGLSNVTNDQQVKGSVRLTVSSTAPTSPSINDLWVDTA